MVGTVDVTIPPVAKQVNATNCTADCSKAGYTALGVIGWNMASGTRQNFLNVWRCFLSNATTVRLDVCNTHATDTAEATCTVYVLYRSN